MPANRIPIYAGLFEAMPRHERNTLKQEYIEWNMSAEAIAVMNDVSPRLIYMRLKEHGLSKKHPVSGIQHKYPKPKYCSRCGQVMPEQ